MRDYKLAFKALCSHLCIVDKVLLFEWSNLVNIMETSHHGTIKSSVGNETPIKVREQDSRINPDIQVFVPWNIIKACINCNCFLMASIQYTLYAHMILHDNGLYNVILHWISCCLFAKISDSYTSCYNRFYEYQL